MIFLYPQAKSIYICGDIHGDFETLMYKVCVKRSITNTLVIVAGDCGFGFYEENYYHQIYKEYESQLSRTNNWLVFIRGNHDNPTYFQEERISYERFRCVPDYSIIKACGHNILCVGGGTSIDRLTMIEEQEKGQQCYWENEQPVFDLYALNNLEFRIDTVVTHSAPTICQPHGVGRISDWLSFDPSLEYDIALERNILDQLREELLRSGHPLSCWYYGHFHFSHTDYLDDIRFRLLGCLEFEEM